MQEENYAIIPCEGVCEFCKFDGTFDEGEGMSMGSPITWKNPNNAVKIRTICSLMHYDSDPFEVAKSIFLEHPEIQRIYLEGHKDKTGWIERSEV